MFISDTPEALRAAAINSSLLVNRSCPNCGVQADGARRIQHKPSCVYAKAAMLRRLPVPRLQLRWYRNDSPAAEVPTECACELILPAGANDTRDVDGHGFIAVQLGRLRGAEGENQMSNDNRHLPSYLVSIDGTATPLNSI